MDIVMTDSPSYVVVDKSTKLLVVYYQLSLIYLYTLFIFSNEEPLYETLTSNEILPPSYEKVV